MSPQMKLLHGRGPDAPVTTREAWIRDARYSPGRRPRVQAAARDHFEARTEHFEANTAFAMPTANGTGCRRADGACAIHPARSNASSDRRSISPRARTQKRRRSGSKLSFANRRKWKRWARSPAGSRTTSTTFSARYWATANSRKGRRPKEVVVRRYLDNVMHAGGRAKMLVERILAFSRSGVGERGPINVQAVIEETLELLAASLPAGVQSRRNVWMRAMRRSSATRPSCTRWR